MAYGTVKVDNITFDNGGSDQNVTVSGLYRATTSGVTVTGTISGAVLVGTTTVSGATVTGNVVQGTTVQGVSGTFTSLAGTTTTGTTANFVSGVFTTQVSGTTVTGTTSSFTSGNFGDVTISDKIIHDGDTNTAIRFPANDTISVETSGSERIRVDSNGRLLIGTNTSRSSQAGTLVYSAQLQVEGSNDDVVGSAFSRFSDDAFPTGLSLQKARGTKALPVIVNNDDVIGFISFSGYDGAKWVASAAIYVEIQGTPGVDDMPGRLGFATTPDGASLPIEAMRINNEQNLLIGYTANNGAYKLQVNSQIFATSATVATSDGRYKENVATLNGCIDLVNALRPVSFDWKPQQDITRIDEEGKSVLVREGHNFPNGKQVGFIAQEVQAVLADKPWLGSVIKQNVRSAIEDADGNELAPEEEFFGIAEGNLIAVLTAALQEAIAKIDALEARIAALEA